MTLLTSYHKYLTNIVRNEKNWEAEFVDVPYSDVVEIAKDSNVKEVFAYYEFGLSKENTSDIVIFAERKYNVKAYDIKALQNANIKLIEGRLPKNSKEIIVTKEKFIDNKIGDKINVTLEEKLREFTIVVIVEKLEEDNDTLELNGEVKLLKAGAVTYLDNNILVNVRILTNNVQKVYKQQEN